ncbi:hypothetical protein J8J14_12620 [Roseomonas sp. SSH11]|uniref:Uncharacterized protein n=1 Tax=Pararoseomonas baculiformis TaxID=2820812 RepID=A0ABS4AF08_9PROT|nr:hypothetical protein [Pararoseomonas baculiformis]MBP0445620.1 hypothetical protein [Pararoseomonas baculiformis]
MARSPSPSDDTRMRDEAASRADSMAPAGMAEARHPAPRPIAHAEEGEAGRGEWWTLVKALLIGALVVMLIGWLMSR